MQQVNVLFIIIQMALGGSEQLVLNIIKNLDRKRFNPSVAWFFGDTVLEEFEALNIPLFHVPKIKKFDFQAMQRIAAIISENNIHIVNAHHFMSMVYSFYGCKFKKRASLIYTEHSKWEVDGISKRWQLIGTCLLRCVDKSVGVSSVVSNAIEKKFVLPVTKIQTIENGIDLSLFSGKESKEISKKRIGIEASEKVIGIVANFRKVKNHIFLIQAFKEILTQVNRVKLLIVGQGFEDDPENSEMEVRRFIRKNALDDKVVLLGYRADIPELLSAMDIFCLCSFREGLPISLIEAMASGLPVIGTNVAGIREVINHEVNGFLVSVGDLTTFKCLLLKLLKDDTLRKRMGTSARAGSRIYALSNCVNKYAELFLEYGCVKT